MHNLNFNEQTGEHSFFSVKEKAWHGLGKIITDYPTSEQAIKFAGLDYEVDKLPNVHELPSGRIVESDKSFFTYRTDNEAILGSSVGKDYHIIQNRDAFSFFDSIVGGGDGILYETAGALGKGERIFITAKLPDYIRVGNDDVIEKYIFLTNTHDGTGSITAAFTPIRIVCANTLNAAIRNMSNVVRIRHTANAKERLEQAHKVMGIADTMSTQLEAVFNDWSTVRITDKQVRKLIELALAPNKEVLKNLHEGNRDDLSTCFTNMVDAAHEYALTNDTQQMDTTKGTVFGAYNAVTGYFQNVRSYKDSEAKLSSLLMGGTAQQRNQTAFNLCADFAKNGGDFLQLN